MAMNEQQLEAVNCNDRTVLCLAGAGAGKSTTMVNRIARQVNDGMPYYSILALTFTNAAAFEMKEKYKKLPGIDPTKIPEFRTFHGFCYSLLIKDKAVRERLGYDKVPEICDDNKLKKLKTQAKLQVGCKLSDAKLSGDIKLNRQEKFEYDVYKKAYTKLIKKENVITFDMLCYNVCELFERKEECIQKYFNKYKQIYVDEFQDTDPRQFKFVSSFGENTAVYFVGDALQSIYAFRGCTNEYIKALSHADGWKIIKMYKNYRSTNQICQFANKMSVYADPEYRIEMEGQRDGDPVEVIRGSQSSFNNPVDPGHLRILVKRLKCVESDTAVLCRTNKEVKFVCDTLDNEGISYYTTNISSDSLDILNSVMDNQYMLDWLSTFLDSKGYSDYIRLAAQSDNPDIRWFLTTYGSVSKIKKARKKIIKIRELLAEDSDPIFKFNNIMKELKLKSVVEFDEDIEYDNKLLLETLRDAVQKQESAKIYVGTIHSSKGLEYDSVYIMGVDDGMFELGTEEMNNLYYVAITRAKNNLTVFKY